MQKVNISTVVIVKCNCLIHNVIQSILCSYCMRTVIMTDYYVVVYIITMQLRTDAIATCSFEFIHNGHYIIKLLIITVQINSNLTLARVSLAGTRLIFKFAHDLVVSARTCLG